MEISECQKVARMMEKGKGGCDGQQADSRKQPADRSGKVCRAGLERVIPSVLSTGFFLF